MQSQFAERRPSKPEQTGQGVAATADPRTRLEDAITALLPAPQSPLHEVAHFHFSRFGKLLRGRTALAVAAAVGLDDARALHWALAVELMHNASLVHDDICDRDEQRRHRSTIFSAFGTPLAICFGDWLVARSFEAATAAVADGQGGAAFAALAAAMRRLSEGQAAEFTGAPVLTWQTYDQVVGEKTAPLSLAPIEGPLMLAGADRHLAPVRRAIHALGLAYQMSNDMLDVLGKDGGAAAYNDLRRRAPNAVSVSFRSLLVNGHRAAFDAWMSSPAGDDIEPWAEQIAATGALEICAQRLQEQLDICRRECADLPDGLRAALSPLVSYLEKATAATRARAAGAEGA